MVPTRGRRAAATCVAGLAVALLAPLVALDSAAARRAPAPPPIVAEVGLVGDSIGRDAKANIVEAVSATHPITYFRAVAAGFIGYYLDDTDFIDVVSAPGGPDIVVAELGTGDAFWDHSNSRFRSDVRRFLDTVLPHVTCIVWVNQKPTPTRAYPDINEHQVAFNEILNDILLEPQYDDRVRLVDYAAWYRLAGDRFFLADLLHHTAAGRHEFARLIAQGVVGCDPSLASGPFWDVPDAHWAAEAIAWLGDEGYARGYPNGTYRAILGSFRPAMSRVQMASLMWRVSGSPAATVGFSNPWSDVPSWADPAVDWLKEHGVVRGFGTEFRPNQTLTRVEAAQWLWRLAGSPTSTFPVPWTDAPAYALPGLAWIAEHELMSGFGNQFRPDSSVTRAQAAGILYAYAHLLAPAAAAEATPSPSGPSTTLPPDTTVAPTTTIAPATTVAPTTTRVAP